VKSGRLLTEWVVLCPFYELGWDARFILLCFFEGL
jgi:hypothetical protein